MSGIKDYSTTPSSNNAAPPNGFPEGMPPASLNDGMRQVMADIRSWFENPEWIDFGDVPTQTGANTFTIATDKTSRYTVGTRIRMIGTTPFTLYGTISASSYSAPNTTVIVSMDSGSLNSTLNAVAINQALKTSQKFMSSVFSLFDVTDVTKKIAFAVSGITTGTTRTVTFPDKDGTIAMTSDLVTVLRNYIDGFNMSTAGSSTTLTIGAGQCADSANAVSITDTNSIGKTTSSWAVGTGNGGLDTGTIANSTWYHVYVIRRPDTGVVDRLISLSASSPTLPANYTQYRRVGSAKTSGSGQWVKFYQDGDNFIWDASVVDINATNPGTSAVTRTLASIPTGVRVYADVVSEVYNPSSLVTAVILSDLDISDETPSIYNTPSNSDAMNFGVSASVVGSNMAMKHVRTNTSAQIRSRVAGVGVSANTVLNIRVRGWIDKRGKQ